MNLPNEVIALVKAGRSVKVWESWKTRWARSSLGLRVLREREIRTARWWRAVVAGSSSMVVRTKPRWFTDKTDAAAYIVVSPSYNTMYEDLMSS